MAGVRAADHHPHPAGLRDRAGQAVARRRRRLLADARLHLQSDRGEFVMGSEIEPWTTYRMQGTLNFLQDLTRHTLELFPQLEHARLLRAWAGLCDLSPDYSPILGKTEVENFHVSAGWGTYGFKAAPIVGKTLAELVAHRPHARADRPVRARALLRGPARLRARRRGGQPLMTSASTDRPAADHTARLLISCPDGPGSSPRSRASCSSAARTSSPPTSTRPIRSRARSSCGWRSTCRRSRSTRPR